MNRREFLETVTAAAVLPAIGHQQTPANEWGSPVFDLHFHLRQQPASNWRTSTAPGSPRRTC